MFSNTTGPLVRGSIAMPAARVSSFSGIRPTDRSSVSQSKRISVPGMGARRSSTCATVTLETRPFVAVMSVTVWER